MKKLKKIPLKEAQILSPESMKFILGGESDDSVFGTVYMDEVVVQGYYKQGGDTSRHQGAYYECAYCQERRINREEQVRGNELTSILSTIANCVDVIMHYNSK